MQMSTMLVDEVAIRVTTSAEAVGAISLGRELVIVVACHCTTFSSDCIKQLNIPLTIFHPKSYEFYLVCQSTLL